MALLGFSYHLLPQCESWYVVNQTQVSRVALNWDLLRTLYQLSYSAVEG